MKKTYNAVFSVVGIVAIAAVAYAAVQLGGYEITRKANTADTSNQPAVAGTAALDDADDSQEDVPVNNIDTSAYDNPEEGKPLYNVTAEGLRFTYLTPWLYVRPENVKGNNDYWWTERPRFTIYVEHRSSFAEEDAPLTYTQAEYDAEAAAVNAGENTQYATTVQMENGYNARFWWDGDEGVGLIPRYDFYVNDYRIRVETILDSYLNENDLNQNPVRDDYSLISEHPELEDYMNEFKGIADSLDFSELE